MGKGNFKNKGFSGFNKKLANAFLEKNRNKPGVVELPSGLQYIIMLQF